MWYVSLCSRVTVAAGPRKILVSDRSRRVASPPSGTPSGTKYGRLICERKLSCCMKGDQELP